MALKFLSPLHKASRQIGTYLGPGCERLGLSPGEGHLLSYLDAYAPCPIHVLHRVFGLKRSTLTSMLDRLESGGLVARRVSDEDRRSFLVDIADRGRDAARVLGREIHDLEQRIEAGLSETDLAGFRAVMAAITEVTTGAPPAGATPSDPAHETGKEPATKESR